jgi:hypothetical protein
MQFFGLGDCLYEQTVVRRVANGNPIIWPVEPFFVEGLSSAFPDIYWVDRTKYLANYNSKEDYVKDGIRYLPMRFADQILKLPYDRCMAAKYQLYHMDYREWKEQAMWHRDEEKEDKLFKQLGLQEGQEYTLINRFFGTNSQLVAPIPDNGVEMGTIEGYSLFDWGKVIQNATIIKTVSTSLLFILEILDLKAKEIHLFPRKPIEQDFRNVEYLFTKNYQLHL